MKSIYKFFRDFLLGFLLTWFAMDMWALCNGNIRPLRRKGINVEWLVNTRQGELSETVNEIQRDRCTYIGFRVTYTYSEPTLIRRTEQ